MTSTNLRKILLFWSLLGLFVRLAYLFEQGTTSVLFYQPLLDELEVSQLADQLLQGQGFGSEPLFKAPLYAIIVAAMKFLTGDGWFWSVRILQHACGAALIAFTLDSARRILGPGKETAVVLHIIGAVLCFYAPLLRLEDRLILDFFVVFFQSAMIWAIIRAQVYVENSAKWMAAAATCAALAWLTRPTMTVVLPFIALWLLSSQGFAVLKGKYTKRRKNLIVQSLILLSLPVLAAVAITARNQMASGEAMTLPWQGGYSFYVSNADQANGRYFIQKSVTEGGDANPAKTLMVREYAAATKTPVQQISYVEVNRWWNKRAWDEIKQEPAAWLKLMCLKALYLVSEREIFNFEEFRIHKHLSNLLWLMPFGFGLIWPFSFASLVALKSVSRGRQKFVWLLWVYAVFLAGGIALYLVSGRLRMPLVFPALLLAAVGLKFLLVQLRERKNRARLIWFGAFFVVGTAMSWGNWAGVRSENLDFAEYSRLSNAAFRSADGELALQFADLAAVSNPEYPTIPQQRGQALYLLGRYEEAALAFEKATELNPQDASPVFNLATIQFDELRDFPAAAASYEEAFRRNTTHARAAWGALKANALAGNQERATALKATLPNGLPLDQWAPEALGAAGVFAGVTNDFALLEKINSVAATRSAREQTLINDDLAKISLRNGLLKHE